MLKQLLDTTHLVVAIDVRMTINEFLAQRIAHLRDVVGSRLLANPGIEQHMKQHIAKFLLDSRVVVAQ